VASDQDHRDRRLATVISNEPVPRGTEDGALR
jgi:hypothetical protein